MQSRERLEIDGAHGEGGGQILRTAVCLAAITERPIRIGNIRAGRPKPGLAAQHLTAIEAVAALCSAEVAGAELGSLSFEFTPKRSVRAGTYSFDVAAARPGGSAGAASLVLQAAALPLTLIEGPSRLSVKGGTHVPWSPPFDYLQGVWLPTLHRLGAQLTLELLCWGWYPLGQGEMTAEIAGVGASRQNSPLKAIDITSRGALRRISGRAVVAKLPESIALRMAEAARKACVALDTQVDIDVEVVQAACPGTGIFITAHYDNVTCGFSALGKRGKPAEQVGEDAVQALILHHETGAALDLHLADQVLLPLALAVGCSGFSTAEITRHLQTNAWVIESFGLAEIKIQKRAGGTGLVTVSPQKA